MISNNHYKSSKIIMKNTRVDGGAGGVDYLNVYFLLKKGPSLFLSFINLIT